MKERSQKFQKGKKADDRGFSLVELIIVIAIMAVLVGVVATQVIPYIESTKQSKDVQILSTYVTAAMTAYGLHADSAEGFDQLKITITSDGSADCYTSCQLDGTAAPQAQCIADELKALIAQDHLTNVSQDFQSALYSKLKGIDVIYNFLDRSISVKTYDAFGVEITAEQPIQGRL